MIIKWREREKKNFLFQHLMMSFLHYSNDYAKTDEVLPTNGTTSIIYLHTYLKFTDKLNVQSCTLLPCCTNCKLHITVTSDGVSRHVSRLKTSRDTYLHVSVLAQSRHIHVLSWLESRSSMSRLGSVSWLSCCVLAQCVLRSWHIRCEHAVGFVKFFVTCW